MKTPSDQIFKLIKRMTAAEKRFMKIHFSSGKSSHLTELFDFLNGQDAYDEHQVKTHFEKSLISKNLKVYKVQLSDLILRSQVAYHAKRKVRSQIRILLEEVDILTDQDLLDQAIQRLSKAIQICKDNNETTLLVVALHHELKMQRLVGQKEVKVADLSQFNEIQKALEEVNVEVKLTQLARLLDLKSICQGGVNEKYAIVRRAIKTINNQDKILEGNNLSAYLLAKIQSMLEQDPDTKILRQEAIMNKFREKGFKFIYDFAYRWEALNDLFYYYVKYGKAEKIRRTSKAYIHLLTNPDVVGFFDQMYLPCFIEAKHNYHKGQSEHEIADFLKIDPEKVDENWIGESIFCVRFYIYRMLDFMTSGKEVVAKKLLSELQSATRSKFIDVNVLLDIVEVIDHFESKNYKTINYLLSSFQRKIKRGRVFSTFTICFYNFIKKMVKYPEKSADFIQTFREEIEALEEDYVHELWTDFHLVDWLDSLEQSYSFYDLKTLKGNLVRTNFDFAYIDDKKNQLPSVQEG